MLRSDGVCKLKGHWSSSCTFGLFYVRLSSAAELCGDAEKLATPPLLRCLHIPRQTFRDGNRTLFNRNMQASSASLNEAMGASSALSAACQSERAAR